MLKTLSALAALLCALSLPAAAQTGIGGSNPVYSSGCTINLTASNGGTCNLPVVPNYSIVVQHVGAHCTLQSTSPLLPPPDLISVRLVRRNMFGLNVPMEARSQGLDAGLSTIVRTGVLSGAFLDWTGPSNINFSASAARFSGNVQSASCQITVDGYLVPQLQ